VTLSDALYKLWNDGGVMRREEWPWPGDRRANAVSEPVTMVRIEPKHRIVFETKNDALRWGWQSSHKFPADFGTSGLQSRPDKDGLRVGQEGRMKITAEEFNELYPEGTPVHAWPMTRADDPLVTKTRSIAWDCCGTPIVKVEGKAGGIALTHIDLREVPA
jgi:hypothetical protein